MTPAPIAAAKIDEKPHAERIEPRHVGVAGLMKVRRAKEFAAGNLAVQRVIAAEIAEIQNALKLNETIRCHGRLMPQDANPVKASL